VDVSYLDCANAFHRVPRASPC